VRPKLTLLNFWIALALLTVGLSLLPVALLLLERALMDWRFDVALMVLSVVAYLITYERPPRERGPIERRPHNPTRPDQPYDGADEDL
jgi:hypothetical protein